MPLNTNAVKKAEARDKPYRIADEKGLCLQVNPCGSKLWRFRYRFNGLAKMISLGTFPEITIDEARTRRDACRANLDKGIDPSEARKARTKTQRVTFQDVAQEWFDQQAPRWSKKHTEIMGSRLQGHIYPTLGKRPIAAIVPIEVVWLTQKIEKAGAVDTAHRVLGTIGQVMRYAVATGRATLDPTAGMQIALAPKPRKKHMAAPTRIDETRRLLECVRSASGHPRLNLQVQIGMQLLPLVFCRPGELRQMRWDDIHWDRHEWRYTASKTKPHTWSRCRRRLLPCCARSCP
jgi:integrase